MKTLVYAFAAVAALGASAHGQADLKNLSGTIKIDGSSTVYPITEAVAEEFKKAAPKVNVTVGISGTGGGFKRFTVGETDISDASRPIKKEENAKAAENKIEYIEIPVAFDGLTIVVNNKNTWVDKLTVDEIKRIFVDGAYAKTWRDVRPGANWPDRPIKIFAPGTDSGTFDYFKEVVAGDKGAIRGDMSVSEDDNVLVRGVEGSEDAIGFFGCAYYFENKDQLKAVPIDAGKGPVLPSDETVEKGTYAPFSRPLFIYVNKRSAARPEVKGFVQYYLKHAPELVKEVGYVRLPSSLYDLAAKNFDAGKLGTSFLDSNGEKIHGPLADIYK